MLSFLSKLFGGNKSKKDVQILLPIVEKINTHFSSFANISNDELRNKTKLFQEQIQKHIEGVLTETKQLEEQANALGEDKVVEKENVFKLIDELSVTKQQKIEEALWTILPEAFAVVKETARRFKENAKLTSIASELDITLANKKKYIKIENGNAIYDNRWLVGGNELVWNMVHYDVQLIGGIVLHQGKISEMATGEGKTLVSTLPAYLNALAGEGVHIVTVNDYLAKRDSEWNAPIFEFLGLRVDCIDYYEPHTIYRQHAYRADITYGTNNEFGFDYLRDNMVHQTDEIVQRTNHFFAMIDEVDSVLIDDARTPLIISGPIGTDDSQQRFFQLKPRVEKLIEAQKKITTNFIAQAKEKITAGNDDPKDGGLDLYRAFRSMPKNSALIKFLSEPNIKVKLQKTENFYLADNQKLMPEVDKELLFHIDEKNNQVDLTEKGLHFITQDFAEKDFFVLPDLAVELDRIHQDKALSNEEKITHKEKLTNDYALKSDRIHSVQQLLKAYTLFEKDDEYVVLEGQVKIVDEQTGRIMEGRRYSDGLHQAIEAKEGVKIEGASQTYATVTLQNYFRMYHKLAGMTGTAETEAQEFWQIYKLDVVSIPTNITAIRKDEQDLVYKTKREKYKAVIDEIEKIVAQQRAVLVGTTSVEVSELLARMLKQKNISHNVLNAKQHAREAQIILEAGLPGKVTIATNMAGRGTDIKLHATVKDNGGLAIIGTERHESRRVDRQLRGRAGRQGDPGSTQFFVSLEDDLMRMFGSDRIASLMDKMGYKEGEVLQHSLVTKSIERAQKKVEENNFGIRKRLLEYDDVMNKQRNVIYKKRSHALFGERLSNDIDNSFYLVTKQVLDYFDVHDNVLQTKLECLSQLGVDYDFTKEELQAKNNNGLVNTIYALAIEHYTNKKANIKTICLPLVKNVKLMNGDKFKNVNLPFTDGKKILPSHIHIDEAIASQGGSIPLAIEKNISLLLIDDMWKDHLRQMDDLRHSVQSAVYEQKDPLVIYKVEAFELFQQLDNHIHHDVVHFLSQYQLFSNEQEQAQIDFKQQTRRTDASKIKTIKQDLNEPQSEEPTSTQEKAAPIIADPKIGRNDACPCGSGKKFKNCHG